jgi:putative Mn2+ efflux pump MntP
MAEVTAQFGQWVTLLILALALGMDAFSLGIGIGMRGIRLLEMIKISAVTGFFHVMMPLTGLFMGRFVGSLLGDVAVLIGGVLLVLLGLHMIYSSFQNEEKTSFERGTLLGICLFAFSVSMDSFSVGISLGLFASDVILAVLLFGLFGGTMSILGLLLGSKVASRLGEYGEALGGVILLGFGLKFLW